jgi:Fe-S cluster assembly protein SufD
MLDIKANYQETIVNLNNNINKVILNKNSKAFIYFLNNTKDIHLKIEQKENSFLEIFFINEANSITINVDFQEEHCHANIFGIYDLNKNQKSKINLNINHNKPNCISNMEVRGIVNDKSYAKVNLDTYVAEGAVKTKATQLHKAIMLSNDANILSQPALEIYNDDVKCSHGNSIGKLDNDAIFYLQTRGIKESKAKEILMSSFLNEVVKNISDKLIKEDVFNHISEKNNV